MAIPKFLSILLVPILFLIIGIATLPHYGISWDEQFHFNRGQAYLHYFLTGKKDFLDLPAYPVLRGTSDFVDRAGESSLYLNAQKNTELPDPSHRRSYYESDVFTASMLIRGFDGGHPPTSDILSALFNNIFYQKLGVLGDIEAYHLFEVFMSSILILGVGVFVYYNFGIFPALISSLALAMYPLFFAESHFNIKDPPQASFFGLALIAFYFGLTLKRGKLVILSSVFAGLALGTKFNILFLPFILLPWLAFSLRSGYLKITKTIVATLLVSPFIAFGLLFLFSPFLWQDPVKNLISIVSYYRSIGIGAGPELGNYKVGGWNTYPILWILYTTPLPILVLSLLGIGFSVFLVIRKKHSASLLTLLWLFVTLGRVSWPGANIYGGVRQIMEYIPALAILAGIGSFYLLQVSARAKRTIVGVIILTFIFVGWELLRIHPIENVYFNQLIGGLAGASQKGIPSWGNNYGTVYLQGVEWLNKNAEPDAKFGLPIGNMVNVPRIKLRPDIYFSNSYPSGPERQGEYVMEMSHDWPPKSWYGFTYYDKFLIPAYEVRAQGVPLLKIWKNDIEHAKPGFGEEQEYKVVEANSDGKKLIIDLNKEIILTRIQIQHNTFDCNPKQVGGYIRISEDGASWTQEPETIDYPQIPIKWLGSTDDTFVFLFAAKNAQHILLDTEMENSCIVDNPQVRVFGLGKLPAE